MLETELYTVEYRNVKHPRLEFKTGTLLVILPKGYGSEHATLEKYKNWILRKERTIKTALQQADSRRLNQDRTDSELRTAIRALAQTYQDELRTHISGIYFRKMKTKWASLSQNGNLTINTLLKYIPDDLIEYVVFHELVHSKCGRKHNTEFWNEICKKFNDYPQKESELLVYWFIIQKREH
jgi:predicted metal-dependent hydrolase